MASVKGAICAICMHDLFVADWALARCNCKASLPAQIRAGRHFARSRQRETDLAKNERRKLFSAQSVSLPPRAGAQGELRLPSHSTRPELPQSFAVRLAMRGRGCSVSPFE